MTDGEINTLHAVVVFFCVCFLFIYLFFFFFLSENTVDIACLIRRPYLPEMSSFMLHFWKKYDYDYMSKNSPAESARECLLVKLLKNEISCIQDKDFRKLHQC